jgi:hypothetical protein
MRLRKSIAAIAVVAAGVGVAVEATATPASAEGPAAGVPAVLINESFRGKELHYDFTLLGQAGLTNAPDGSDHAPKLGHDRKDYDGDGPSPQQSDARAGAPQYHADAEQNPGYLQLTDNNHDKVGGVIYNHALPTSGGLDVTFEMYQYNSTTPDNGIRQPADGIGFFISDGSIDLEAHRDADGTLVPGAYGGSLGYAQKYDEYADAQHRWTPGVIGGYLGVGFDVLGNYMQDKPECRGSYGGKECTYPNGVQSPSNGWYLNVPNTITLRGPAASADGLDGYEYLTSTLQKNDDGSIKKVDQIVNGKTYNKPISSLPGNLGEPSADVEKAARLVRVTVSNEQHPTVNVYVAFNGSPETLAASDPVLSYPMPHQMPETFKFGFTGSTGDMTDVHLIRNLEVSTLVAPPPGLELQKDVAAGPEMNGATPPASYRVGDKVYYDFTVKNTGSVPLTNVTISDRFKLDSITPAAQAHLPVGQSATFKGTYTIKESDAPPEWNGTSPFELENVAVAVSNETASADDNAIVSVNPPEKCTPGAPDCAEEPDPEPSEWPEAIPLPPVGGTPSALGVAGLSVAAALIACLIALRLPRVRREP